MRRDEWTDDELDEMRTYCPVCQASPCVGHRGKGSCLKTEQQDDERGRS